MKTIKAIKAWVRKEEKRLQQRLSGAILNPEITSLEGSLLTIRKLKEYLK